MAGRGCGKALLVGIVLACGTLPGAFAGDSGRGENMQQFVALCEAVQAATRIKTVTTDTEALVARAEALAADISRLAARSGGNGRGKWAVVNRTVRCLTGDAPRHDACQTKRDTIAKRKQDVEKLLATASEEATLAIGKDSGDDAAWTANSGRVAATCGSLAQTACQETKCLGDTIVWVCQHSTTTSSTNPCVTTGTVGALSSLDRASAIGAAANARTAWKAYEKICGAGPARPYNKHDAPRAVAHFRQLLAEQDTKSTLQLGKGATANGECAYATDYGCVKYKAAAMAGDKKTMWETKLLSANEKAAKALDIEAQLAEDVKSLEAINESMWAHEAEAAELRARSYETTNDKGQHAEAHKTTQESEGTGAQPRTDTKGPQGEEGASKRETTTTEAKTEGGRGLTNTRAWPTLSLSLSLSLSMALLATHRA